MLIKTRPHPRSFKITWVDKTFLHVKEWFLVTLKTSLYFEDIYCEVVPMNVAHLLLACPWLYDNVVKHYGRNNIYKFTQDKNIILLRLAKPVTGIHPVAKSYASNTLIPITSNLDSQTFWERKCQVRVVSALVAAGSFTMSSGPSFTHFPDVSSMFDEFRDTMPDELPDVLPPLRDI